MRYFDVRSSSTTAPVKIYIRNEGLTLKCYSNSLEYVQERARSMHSQYPEYLYRAMSDEEAWDIPGCDDNWQILYNKQRQEEY